MIPNNFEDYRAKYEAELPLETRGRDALDHCDGCGKENPERLTRDGHCDRCVAYRWGFDQAEEKLVRAILGGAVRGALAGGCADLAIIRGAVDDTLDSVHEDELLGSAERRAA